MIFEVFPLYFCILHVFFPSSPSSPSPFPSPLTFFWISSKKNQSRSVVAKKRRRRRRRRSLRKTWTWTRRKHDFFKIKNLLFTLIFAKSWIITKETSSFIKKKELLCSAKKNNRINILESNRKNPIFWLFFLCCYSHETWKKKLFPILNFFFFNLTFISLKEVSKTKKNRSLLNPGFSGN